MSSSRVDRAADVACSLRFGGGEGDGGDAGCGFKAAELEDLSTTDVCTGSCSAVAFAQLEEALAACSEATYNQ